MLIFNKDMQKIIEDIGKDSNNYDFLTPYVKNKVSILDHLDLSMMDDVNDFFDIYFSWLLTMTDSNNNITSTITAQNNILEKTIIPMKSTKKISIIDIINVLTMNYGFISQFNYSFCKFPSTDETAKNVKVLFTKPGVKEIFLCILFDVLTGIINVGIISYMTDENLEDKDDEKAIYKIPNECIYQLKCTHPTIRKLSDDSHVYICNTCGVEFNI